MIYIIIIINIVIASSVVSACLAKPLTIFMAAGGQDASCSSSSSRHLCRVLGPARQHRPCRHL
jgi:hypothetical protein